MARMKHSYTRPPSSTIASYFADARSSASVGGKSTFFWPVLAFLRLGFCRGAADAAAFFASFSELLRGSLRILRLHSIKRARPARARARTRTCRPRRRESRRGASWRGEARPRDAPRGGDHGEHSGATMRSMMTMVPVRVLSEPLSRAKPRGSLLFEIRAREFSAVDFGADLAAAFSAHAAVFSIEPAAPGHSSESPALLPFPARSRPRDGPSEDPRAWVDRCPRPPPKPKPARSRAPLTPEFHGDCSKPIKRDAQDRARDLRSGGEVRGRARVEARQGG